MSNGIELFPRGRNDTAELAEKRGEKVKISGEEKKICFLEEEQKWGGWGDRVWQIPHSEGHGWAPPRS